MYGLIPKWSLKWAHICFGPNGINGVSFNIGFQVFSVIKIPRSSTTLSVTISKHASLYWEGRLN